MANPLKILTHLSASEAADFAKAVKFNEVVTLANKKIVGLAEGTAAGDAVRYEQLTAEASLRVSGDSSLTSRLSVEESNREAAVSSETSSRISGDNSLGARVSAEESTRASADTSLTSRISAEELARASAVTSAATSIDARVSTEESARASADTSLTTRLSAEESVRASADTAEASVRASADASLTARLSAEESASLSVDVSLSGRITDEASIRASADGSLALAFASADTSLSTRLASEESSRASADTSLTSRISAEESARASAIVAANSSLDSRISAEESTRASADGSLAVAFASADTSLTTRLSTEESVRGSAVVSIDAAISVEGSTRALADSSLTTRLSTEEVARASADTSLTSRVSTEESVRASADASLVAALSAEASSRAAEDLKFLYLDGTRAMQGGLNMGGYDITSAKSGSFSGDVTVQGSLNVKGALTYLETTNTQVKDNQIELNYAATPVSNANAGIVIKGSEAGKDVSMIVDADGGNLVVNTMVSASALKASGNGELGGALVVKGQAAVSASLMISGASFGDAGADAALGYANNMYNVDSAIRFLAGRSTGMADGYTSLRHVADFALVGGTKTYALPETAAFASGQLNKIMVDVLVAGTTGGWVNDLIAVKLETVGSYLQVVIDAPAHGNGNVRLIAVNEGMGIEGE
jgi:hypothetical protein